MHQRLLYAADPGWAAIAERLHTLMAEGDFRALKDEGRTRAGLLAVPGGGSVFVKRVRTGSWVRGVIARARGSRVRRWLDGAAMLGAAEFNRPAPLGALEVYRAGALVESYLMCEALSEATVLSRAVLDEGRVHFRSRRMLLNAVMREVRRLHDAGLYTLDLQETNLMIEERAAAPPRISFVDLEDFRQTPSVSWQRRILNLVHLDRSIGRFLSRSARLRCLHDYLGDDARDRGRRRRTVQQFWRLRDELESRRRGRVRRIIASASPGEPLPPPAAATVFAHGTGAGVADGFAPRSRSG